jgi:glucokinase
MASKPHLLVADIGGTNGRLAIAAHDAASGEVSLAHLCRFENDQFESLAALLAHYLDSIPASLPEMACLAVAGPNDGRRGYMINRDWEINADAIEASCGMQRVQLVNDFEALAAAVPGLAADDVSTVHAGEAGLGPCAVIGPGTGFGVAQLIAGMDDAPLVISTEGGHMALAPGNTLEQELWAYLQSRVDYICVESVLSGQGLVRLQQFLSERAGEPVEDKTASQITGHALAGSDSACLASVQLFLGILGGAIGDIALAQGATGGVYLGGGMLPRIAGLIPDSELVPRFLAKGPLKPYLSKIPIHLITAEHVALKGAARLFCYS